MSTELTPKVRSWIETVFEGNLDAADWTLTTVSDAAVTIPVKVDYGYQWANLREKTSTALSDGTLDAQIDRAMQAGSPGASLAQAVAASPRTWLKKFDGTRLEGWSFAETRLERCESCSGVGNVGCSPCNARGRVTCGNCSQGRERVTCAYCSGMGRHRRERQVMDHTGHTVSETYYETCGACSAGTVYQTCRTCNGSALVNCSNCSGTGRLTCSDCRGAGKRLFRYARWVQVKSSVATNASKAGHEGLRALITSRWNDILSASGLDYADVVVGAPGPEALSATASVSIPSAVCDIAARDGRGQIWALGGGGDVRGSDPVLIKALDLPEAGETPSWTEVAERLAGKRVLRDAMSALDQTKGDLKTKAEGARLNLGLRYGPLLGDAGATAVASAAAQGVNHLRGHIQKRVWWSAVGLALGFGILLGLWAIHQIATVPEFEGAAARKVLIRAWLIGPVIGIGAAVLSRILATRVLARLGMTGGARPPGFAKLFWPAAGVSLLPFVGMVLIAAAGFALSWPEGFRERMGGPGASSRAASNTAVTTANVRMRLGANAQADVVATVPKGATVRLDGATLGDWTRVRYGSDIGWIATRYLEVPDGSEN